MKLMQHFGIAKEYEKSAETLSITYYCLMYIANEAIKLQKDKQFVAHVLDYLEAVGFGSSPTHCSVFVHRPNEVTHTMRS